MAKILIVGTNMMNIYNHRLELINRLLSLGHTVSVVAPSSGEEKALIQMGVLFIDTPVDNRGKNPLNDLRLLSRLMKVFKHERPDVVLTFYTKTNIYGGLAARMLKIPYIENITGLGSAVANGGLLGKVMLRLYGAAVKKASIVFFQNTSNQKFFHDKHIALLSEKLLPGSGVSLERFTPLPYPTEESTKFVFISRVLREKGIYEFVEAAKIIKREFPAAEFHVVGPYDESYSEYLNQNKEEGNIIVHGKVIGINSTLSWSNCTVFPSYYAEGMANVLLESAASARPIITTDMPGCGETVEDGETGFVVRPKDAEDLADKIRKFLALSREQQIQMGLKGREKMQKEFNREIVVEAYVSEINKILGI